MAKTGKIPASKVGAQWRYRKEDVEDWLMENRNVSKAEKKKRRESPRKGTNDE